MRTFVCAIVMSGLILSAGCKGRERDERKPIIFWHTQSDQRSQILTDIVNEFNAAHPALPVRAEYIGRYDTIYNKTLTALLAKRPPDLAVAYESMVAEYMRYDAVVDLDPYLNEMAPANRADVYPAFLATNRFPAFGSKLLSMPFTKSVLMLYYNKDLLKKLGRSDPPGTWDEFLAVCADAKEKLGISGYAFSKDASTFDAFVFSFAGEVYDPKTKRALFDQPPTVQALSLIDDLFRRKLAHEIAYDTYDDRSDFAQQRCVFFIRSSTSRPYVMELVKGAFEWDMAMIPQGPQTTPPRTVLFGANVCAFKTTPDRQRAAWEFIRYFISKEVTARWARHTGYLPVRKSALDTATFKQFLAEAPANGRGVDVIDFAQAEPNVRGWQEVRTAIERTIADVINGRKSPAQAAQTLQAETTKILQGK